MTAPAHKLVPVEPTDDMDEAADNAFHAEMQKQTKQNGGKGYHSGGFIKAMYGAMLSASPDAPSTPEGWQDIATVLRAYEAWESDLILNGDWSSDLPRLNQSQYDQLIALQSRRNAALAGLPSHSSGDAEKLREAVMVIEPSLPKIQDPDTSPDDDYEIIMTWREAFALRAALGVDPQ